MRKYAIILCLTALLTLSAAAQTKTGMGERNGEVALGWTHLTGDVGKNGWDASAAYNFGRNWGLEGDIAGYYGDKTLLFLNESQNVHSFMAGPKFMFDTNDQRFTPFAHFLIGVAHVGADTNVGINQGDTSLAWALGGGVDWNFNDRWAARGKADLFHTSFFDNGDTHARFGLGIVYKWGR